MDNIKCDYLTLWVKDAYDNSQSDLVNGLCVWDVNEESYFYKDKALVTLMSIVDATLDRNIQENVTIMTQMGMNGSSSVSPDSSVSSLYVKKNQATLGSFIAHTRDAGTQFYQMGYSNSDIIELQVSPQPNQIRINFFFDDKSPVNLYSSDGGNLLGKIVIKFKYFNQREYHVSSSPF